MSQPSVSAAVPAAAERPPAAVERAPVSAPALVRYNPYRGLHRSWLHGYWSLPAGGPAAGNPGRAEAGRAVADAGVAATSTVREPGMGRGWGMTAWLTGPMVYRWGYFSYANPYVAGEPPRPGAGPTAIDYSHPIDVESAPPTEALLNDALQHFATARAAFRREEYTAALRSIDDALVVMPSDPAVHQLRALALLSLHRYRDAAAAYHAVIAVVPGWDWTTMIRLYGNPDIYTHQLRMLEAYSVEHPQSAEARFLLAVHYLTAGFPDAAANELEELAEQRPDDLLPRQLLREMRPTDSGSPAPTPPRPGKAGKLEGIWTAHPRAGTTIFLSFKARGLLECRVLRGIEETTYRGFYLHDRDTLLLTQDQDNTLTGELTWTDPRHFTFRLFESQGDDTGLAFEQAP